MKRQWSKTDTVEFRRPPVAEWIRPLNFRALNRSSSQPVGSRLARVTFETSQVLLAGGQVLFLGISRFRPTYRLTRLKMSELILTGRKTQKRKKIESHFLPKTPYGKGTQKVKTHKVKQHKRKVKRSATSVNI